MNTPSVPHTVIAASAGSGKTWQLAHRYIRLLALGVPSRRVCALTFSRKAAGEILDSIVTYLAAAAGDANAATRTASAIQMPELTTADFGRCLRHFVNDLHRNQIGTLDSFIIGIARAFPAELGIDPAFGVMDEESPEALELRYDVLERLFAGGAVNAHTRERFLAAYQRSTVGKQEKTVGSLLNRYLKDFRATYRLLPDADRWGDPAVIWPGGQAWLQNTETIDAAASALADAVDGDPELTDGMRDRWHVFIAAAAMRDAGTPIAKDLGYLLDKLLADWDALLDGPHVVTIDRRKVELNGAVRDSALRVVGCLLRDELQACLTQTEGLHGVLALYDELYSTVSRRTGRMSFDDVQVLLGAQANRPVSSVPGSDARLFIDYRLDATLDHWLIDEFQDTSDQQWAVLRNLADEVLQSPEGTRSFFYVGDVKQAIYGWRGGNPRLFHQILERYPERIIQQDLSASYRSNDHVIDFVNQVFNDLDGLGLPPDTVAAWSRIWQTHTTATDVVPQHGYAALMQTGKEASEEDLDPVDELTAALVRDLDPVARGLEVAILVRSNSVGARVVDALRRLCPDVHIAHEGSAGILENTVVPLLLSLVQWAAHPGDSLARRHLEMSPLDAALDEQGPRHRLPTLILREAQQEGYEALMTSWGNRLRTAIGGFDDFGEARFQDLLDAASVFDSRPGADPDAFCRHVEAFQVRESGADASVRVMTLHQSKGLGFDVAIMPELSTGKSLKSSGAVPFAVHRSSADDTPEWALKMPSRGLAQVDPVLAGVLDQADAEDALEALCVLYVGMTRAKKGLYLLTTPASPRSTVVNVATVLRERLAGVPRETVVDDIAANVLAEAGEPLWYETNTPDVTASTPAQAVPAGPLPHGTRPRLERVLPSSADDHVLNIAQVFDPDSRHTLDFGTLIHAYFERVEWWDDAALDELLAAPVAEINVGPAMQSEAAAHFREAFAAPEIRSALQRPGPHATVWRERQFDMIHEGRLVTGVFDRVVITRDADGTPRHATIQDFKTNRVATEDEVAHAAEGYREQLRLYRDALGRILPLAPEQIESVLLFTRPGRVVHVT